LAGTPIKQIAQQKKVSKNTVKKYRSILNEILIPQPSLRGDLPQIMEAFRTVRSHQRFSENHGWLETHDPLVEKLATKCDNYVRLLEVQQEHGFHGSYSSLMRYVWKNEAFKEKPVFRIETKPGEVAQVDFGSIGRIFGEETGAEVKALRLVLQRSFTAEFLHM
jgi:hypothetical protein